MREYLSLDNIRFYLVDVVAGKLIKGQRAVSKAYLGCLKWVLNVISWVFVWPRCTPPEWDIYEQALANVRTIAGKWAAELQPKCGNRSRA